MAERATGYVARDFAEYPLYESAYETRWDEQAMPLLSLREAADRARHDIDKGLDPLSVAMKAGAMPTYQNGLPFCWNHALVMGAKVKFAQAGQPIPRLSATAGACLITGYRERGGNCREAMPFAAEVGIPTIETWPENSKARSNDTPAMRAEAAKYKMIEWYALPSGSDEHKWTALANRFCLWSGYSNIGHAMLSARLLPDANQPGCLDINSWSKRAADATEWDEKWLDSRDVIWRRSGRDFRSFECYAIRVTTIAA